MTLITLDINPMQIPAISNRIELIEQYARRWHEEFSAHETLDSYAEQAALDLRDPSITREVKAAIRRIRREGYKHEAKGTA